MILHLAGVIVFATALCGCLLLLLGIAVETDSGRVPVWTYVLSTWCVCLLAARFILGV